MLKVALVALVEGNDGGHVPTLSGEAEKAHSVVSRIERGCLDGQTEGLAAAEECSQALDAAVAVAESGELSRVVRSGEDDRQLAMMSEAIGRGFVEAVAVGASLATAIPAPKGNGMVIRATTRTAALWSLVLVVTGAQLLAAGLTHVGNLLPSPAMWWLCNSASLNGAPERGQEQRFWPKPPGNRLLEVEFWARNTLGSLSGTRFC